MLEAETGAGASGWLAGGSVVGVAAGCESRAATRARGSGARARDRAEEKCAQPPATHRPAPVGEKYQA